MDRLSPTQEADIVPAGSAGGSAVRTTLYMLLAAVLAAGGWVRFSNQVAQMSPWLAAPAQQAAAGAAADASVKGLMELRLLPASAESGAVAGIGLPAGQAAQLADALKRDRVHLIQLPLFDAGAVTADGSDLGRSVLVSTAGFSRLVRLGRQPVVLTLPIDRAGTISFSTAAAGSQPVEVGAITMTGPLRLPALSRGQVLDVGVVAE